MLWQGHENGLMVSETATNRQMKDAYLELSRLKECLTRLFLLLFIRVPSSSQADKQQLNYGSCLPGMLQIASIREVDSSASVLRWPQAHTLCRNTMVNNTPTQLSESKCPYLLVSKLTMVTHRYLLIFWYLEHVWRGDQLSSCRLPLSGEQNICRLPATLQSPSVLNKH